MGEFNAARHPRRMVAVCTCTSPATPRAVGTCCGGTRTTAGSYHIYMHMYLPKEKQTDGHPSLGRAAVEEPQLNAPGAEEFDTEMFKDIAKKMGINA